LPAAWLLAEVVPPAVVAVPEPEPCAADELEFVGVVVVFDPVWVVAVPVEGVDPVEEPPAVALAELPVEAEADEPPEPDELADVEVFVVVEALAEPPVVVGEGVGLGVVEGVGLGVGDGVGLGVGDGVGLGVGDGVGLGVGDGVGLGVGEGVRLDVGDGVGLGVGDGVGLGVGEGVRLDVGVGEGAGLGVGVGVCATPVELLVVVDVVDVVEVPDDPPLIEGSTLMIGCTVMVGE
jgi:hypothetical protein